MRIEDVKQWQCGNGIAVAVNPYSQKSKVFNRFGGFDGIPNSQIWEEFEDWRLNPANQPVTDLYGIFNSEQVKEVWDFTIRGAGEWHEVLPSAYKNCNNNYSEYEKLWNSEYFDTRRRLVPVEAALCNTDKSLKEGDLVQLIENDVIEFASNSEAGSKWIDVKYRLPENQQTVNAKTMGGGIHKNIVFRDGKFWSVFTSQTSYETVDVECKNIISWQPLPSAPNETNVSPRSYTHEQVLAFGERVKQGAAILAREGTLNGEYSWKIGSDILSIDLNKIEIK